MGDMQSVPISVTNLSDIQASPESDPNDMISRDANLSQKHVW